MEFVQSSIAEFDVKCQRCQTYVLVVDQPAVRCGSCERVLFHKVCVSKQQRGFCCRRQEDVPEVQCLKCQDEHAIVYPNTPL